MLARHSLIYLLVRGLPGLLNFFALALYTRLVTPEQYGLYALVFASVSLCNAILFQWLRLGLLRFLPAFEREQRHTMLTSTLLAGFLLLALITSLAGASMAFFQPDGSLRTLILLGTVLLWVQAWFEISLELLRSRLHPERYGLVFISKSLLTVGISGTLAYLGFGAIGLLLGVIFGQVFALLAFTRTEWRGTRLRKTNWQVFKQVLVYGLPLTGTFALNFVISSSDRLLIGWLLGSDATGLYAVGYELAKQTMWVLMTAINSASYPLAVRALEQHGLQAVQKQLSQNATLLLAITVPAAAGLAMLAPNIAHVFLGAEFRQAASALIPWIVLGTLLGGLTNFYLVQAFQLGKNTMLQLWPFGISALVNVLLNLWLIPIHGVMGAAYATVAAYASNALLCVWIGKRVFPMPFPLKNSLKVFAATALMFLALVPTIGWQGVSALVAQVSLGLAVYALASLALNTGNLRGRLVAFRG
ncbi:MAG: lipopolysaccharide biosynthesis protein [Desulfurococcaceae archaeon]